MAEPLSVRATMIPKEQIKLDFKDGSGHFVLMVRREGKASGSGLFNDASVVEYGRHDIIPGVAGDPSGYLVVSKGEAISRMSSGRCAQSFSRARTASPKTTTTVSGKSSAARARSTA
jgi:hypothetical protein